MAIPDNLTRKEYVAYANIAEKGHRYREMVECAKKLMAISVPSRELTPEERDVISIAYDGVIQPLRVSWRIYEIAKKEEEDQPSSNSENMKKFLRKLRCNVLIEFCSIYLDIERLYNSFHSRNAPDLSDEMNLFLYKLVGDYRYYFAETGSTEDDRKRCLKSANESYQSAQCIVKDLHPSNPLKRGLAYSLISYYCWMCDLELDTLKAAEEEVLSDFDPKRREVYDRIQELYFKWEAICPTYPSILELEQD